MDAASLAICLPVASNDDGRLDVILAASGCTCTVHGHDGILAAFARASDAVSAALAVLRGGPSAALGLDGTAHGARILALAAQPGRALVSEAMHAALEARLPEDARLAPLGEHRLADLAPPAPVLDLLHPDVPAVDEPPRTLDTVPHNLPVLATSFVGREELVAEVIERLRRERLVTLTGPGGTGKTRLALQAAAETAARLTGGVWLVELAPLRTGDDIAEAIRRTLGIADAPGTGPVAAIAGRFAGRPATLILDNCEHVLASVGPVAEQLLGAGAEIRVLATSRAALGLDVETVVPVPTLRSGDDGTAAEVLFADRAVAVQPAFRRTGETAHAVRRICAQLDGLPLAVELAAARTRVLTPLEIEQRLGERLSLLRASREDGRPAHHATLRALLDWSYELLEESERTVFRRLAVFAGDASLEGADDVCCVDDVIDALDGLARKSLVVVDQAGGRTRYEMLETIRAYAVERLEAEDDPAAALRRHAAHFARLAAAAAEGRSVDDRPWVAILDRESENTRAALNAAAQDAALAEVGLRIAVSLFWYWQVRGRYREGLEAYDRALQAASSAPASLRARALASAGAMARLLGDFSRATELYELSHRLADESGEDDVAATALSGMGLVAWQTGDLDAARSHHERALEIRRSIGAPIDGSLNNLGIVERELGRYAQARALFEQALEIKRRRGETSDVGMTLTNLGVVSSDMGDHSAAYSFQEEALSLYRTIDSPSGLVLVLTNLGVADEAQGRDESARARYLEALDLCSEIGDRTGAARLLHNLAVLALGRSECAVADEHSSEALRIAREIGEPASIARNLQLRADLALIRGRANEARAATTEALELRRSTGERRVLPESLASLGAVAWEADDLVEAARWFADAAPDLDRCEVRTACLIRASMGTLALATGDRSEAARLAREALADARRTGDPRAETAALVLLARLDLASDAERASSRLSQAISVRWKLHDLLGVAECLDVLAQAVAAWEPRRAAVLSGAAEAIRDELGVPAPRRFETWTRAVRATCVEALGEDGYRRAEATGRHMSIEEAVHDAVAALPREAAAVTRAGGTDVSQATGQDEAVFRLDGEYWTIAFAGTRVRMRDAKGLRYLAALLSRPGTEVHCADLVAPTAGDGNPEDLAVAAADAGALLDPQAKAEYKRRVEELRAELAEAETWGDTLRASRAQEEIDTIARELAAAFGLGGRARKGADTVERIRKAVTNRIRASQAKIAAEHPDLGRHLANAIRTGVFCAYEPDRPVRWTTS